MDMHKLIMDYKKYFWSKNEDKFVCGGYDDNACCYGVILITFNDEVASITWSTGTGLNTPKFYPKGESNYILLEAFTKELDKYLSHPETDEYQDLHRETLIRNVAEFFPRYIG